MNESPPPSSRRDELTGYVIRVVLAIVGAFMLVAMTLRKEFDPTATVVAGMLVGPWLAGAGGAATDRLKTVLREVSK